MAIKKQEHESVDQQIDPRIGTLQTQLKNALQSIDEMSKRTDKAKTILMEISRDYKGATNPVYMPMLISKVQQALGILIGKDL